jgi:predicted unusual protein kinase regulating ubiquinone biosynthesis (AarF/ABC1/UbiB family)
MAWVMARTGADEARRALRHEAWARRAAGRLCSILGELKGAFAKAGQFASTRHDLLPAVATEALGALRDRVPPLPAPVIRRAVEQALGASLETCFARFDPAPIGAASIAQAHRAALPDGREVVVKVQYPWLSDALPADVAILSGAARAWLFVRGLRGDRVDVGSLIREFAAGLEEELDFEREAAVAGEIAANLAADDRIRVPEIVASHTRKRVLTMQYHDAIGIDDPVLLRAHGFEPADVLQVLARAYSKQVFVDGLFHADPHPGNLFVLKQPDDAGRPRVLFVDFGLSRRLGPELRANIRQGIYALLQRDRETFVSRMHAMGMIAPGAEANVSAAVDAMLARIAGDTDAAGIIGASGSQIIGLKDEAKQLLQATPGLQLPNDLLLYAKTLSYLFALGEELAPEVDLMKLALPYLLQFLASSD